MTGQKDGRYTQECVLRRVGYPEVGESPRLRNFCRLLSPFHVLCRNVTREKGVIKSKIIGVDTTLRRPSVTHRDHMELFKGRGFWRNGVMKILLPFCRTTIGPGPGQPLWTPLDYPAGQYPVLLKGFSTPTSIRVCMKRTKTHTGPWGECTLREPPPLCRRLLPSKRKRVRERGTLFLRPRQWVTNVWGHLFSLRTIFLWLKNKVSIKSPSSTELPMTQQKPRLSPVKISPPPPPRPCLPYVLSFARPPPQVYERNYWIHCPPVQP